MLGKQQRESLFQFIDALTLLLSESVKKSEVPVLRAKLNHSLACMERDFPMTMKVSI